jgi:hypothetical protein
MDEREFYTGRRGIKTTVEMPPHHRVKAEYHIRWVRRMKKKSLARGARRGRLPHVSEGTGPPRVGR